MIFYASPVHYAAAVGMYFVTGCLGMSVTYHRYWSHSSWRAPRWFEILGTLAGTLGLTGSALGWIAIHRDHHRSTDRPSDPHSPLHQSFLRVQYLSMFQRPHLFFVRDLIRDPLLRFTHRHYFAIQLIFVGLIACLLGPFSVIYLYLFPAAILWNAGSLINNFGHGWGYRNFNTRDHSRNNPLLGFFMWGEGWHNNHHAYPSRSCFGVKNWELDISALMIRLLERPRRVSKSKVPVS